MKGCEYFLNLPYKCSSYKATALEYSWLVCKNVQALTKSHQMDIQSTLCPKKGSWMSSMKKQWWLPGCETQRREWTKNWMPKDVLHYALHKWKAAVVFGLFSNGFLYHRSVNCIGKEIIVDCWDQAAYYGFFVVFFREMCRLLFQYTWP